MPATKNLHALRNLWAKESAFYKKSEVGSGVQSFVWQMLSAPELFNLDKGLKSTKAHDRRSEFLLEESNKNGQADAVIFMDAEVVIPVEVEKFDNAQSGEWQILKYRTAFDRSYGILTDGFEWRFYYGDIQDNQHYRFTLDEMLSQPERFHTFWSEYVKPANYYLSFFEPVLGKQQKIAAEIRLPVDTNRIRFFSDVTEIIRKLKDKLLNVGYLKSVTAADDRQRKATEIAYSYLIQFILYKTLVDNGFGTFEADFAQKSALIHQKLLKGSFTSILMILEGMSATISKNIYKPFHKEQEAILAQIQDHAHTGVDDLMYVAPFLDIFVFIRRYDFADVQNDIFGSVYENYLKELYEEQQLGQYFTDPSVVNFMLAEVGYSAAEIASRDHDHISIIDPSCGSGTFLYSAVREIVRARKGSGAEHSKAVEHDILSNVFGLDIADFPLYLAEMSILMRMLPVIVSKKYNNPVDKKLKLFVTEDSLSEFIGDVSGRGASNDLQAHLALEWEYTGFMRDEIDLSDMKKSLKRYQGATHETIPRRRFDYVVGNPPYIGYNESAKLGTPFFKSLQSKTSNVSLNDVYGWNLHSAPGNQKKYGPKPNLYAFFLALGFALLKENGVLCYIIPQTLLTAGDLDVVRYELAKHYSIMKIFTFAGNLFVGRGTGQNRKVATSSLILVCRKTSPASDHVVSCLHVNDPDLDVKDVFAAIESDRSQYTRHITQQRLRESVSNWNFLQWDPQFSAVYEKYRQNSRSLAMYYDHASAEKEFGNRFYFDKGLVFPKDQVRSDRKGDFLLLKNSRTYSPIIQEKSIDKHYIRLPDGSQGMGLFDCKYKLVWSYMNPANIKFTDQRVMLDFNWVIIASEDKPELLFLFGLMNSSLIWAILNSLFRLQNEKSFSLGIKAIKEFVRVPLGTGKYKTLKRSVQDCAAAMLKQDQQTLGDLVSIDTLVQHFDDVRIDGEELVMLKGSKRVIGVIRPGSTETVRDCLEQHHGSAKAPQPISLQELMQIPVNNMKDRAATVKLLNEAVFELFGMSAEDTAIVKARAL